MSATDYRTLHVYRLPVYQKRVVGIDNCISNARARSPSPNRPVIVSGRRHSTPPASTKRIVDVSSPPSNTFIKFYHHHHYTRPTCLNKDQNAVSESVKSPPRPISLVKLRHQEERVVRVVTTPTSINSFTDIILPMAKKNCNTIVETPSSIGSEVQSIHRNTSSGKRGKGIFPDSQRDFIESDEDSIGNSTRDDNCELKSIKCCHGKCPCRFSRCNFCHWYCSCPFCCWILCFLLTVALFIGIVISLRLQLS